MPNTPEAPEELGAPEMNPSLVVGSEGTLSRHLSACTSRSSKHAAVDAVTAGPDGNDAPAKQFTVFGRPVHLAFVRTYTPPLDVDFSKHSFDMYSGLLFKDPIVADQFRAFYFRSFLSFTMGTVYAFAFLLVAATPIITKQYSAVLAAAGTALVVTMLVDLSLHLFAPVSPAMAKVRMVASFLVAAVSMSSLGWTMFSAMTECDDSAQLPYFTGRLNVSVEKQRRLCVQMFEPYQVGSILLGSLGVLVYPIPHAFLALLHFLLCFVAGRQIATGPHAHEQPGEIAVEALMFLVCEFGAMAITYVRFSAGRSAFEATIKVEMQRREAAARAAELHKLLNTIVPAAVLPRLEAGSADQFQIDNVPSASMLFADMKGFTAWSSSRSAEAVTSMLNTVVAALDALAVRTDSVEKVKTIGDAYWAVSGIPVEAQNHADQLVLFGWRMNQIVADLNQSHAEWNDVTWRVGIHSGPMTGALFGERQVSYEVFGETSRIAQVVEAHGVPGSVVVTEQAVAALLHRPEEKYLRAHDVLDSLGPADGVLTMYEFLEPADAETETSSIGGPSNRARSGGVSPTSNAPGLLPGATTHRSSNAPSLSGPSVVGSSQSIPSFGEVVSARKRSRYLTRSHPNARRSVHLVSDHPNDARRSVVEMEQCIDDEALEAFEKPRWTLLPYFENPGTEALFKARCEVVCRNMNRVSSALLLGVHVIYMATLVAMPDPCFHPVGVPMQFLALIPYFISIGFAAHPRSSLQISSAALVAAASLGLTGTGLTALNGCEAGHDLLAYSVAFSASVLFSAGPLSWPLLSALVMLFSPLPTMIFALFFSPSAVGAIIMAPVAGVMMAMMAFTEERLLRRRFIEEELSKRAEAQLADLGEQRVEVLQRLVPQHVVFDLITWFGANMDPSRSITRSYARVIIAFMRLRPEAFDSLPRLHAEVDTDLRTICESLQARNFRDPGNATAPELEHAPELVQPTPASTSTLDKIKTVGDLVMVAGPFPDAPASTPDEPSGTLHVADSEIFTSFRAAVMLFDAVRAKCPVQVGMHMGPVVGTVQGSSRLAFDVFGDPVNVASRVLTGASGSASSLHVSGTLAAFVGPTASAGAASTFGPPLTVTAKGKGALEVFALTKSESADFSPP